MSSYQKVNESKHAIHRIRFYKPEPSSAHSLAFCKHNNLLALSRANHDIEIWNMNSHRGKIGKNKSNTGIPYLQKWIPGNSESSVEGMAWAQGRLFSTGLHGLVLEHDLDTLSTKRQFAVTSGPAWCIAYNEKVNRIAVGTEEGYICLFEVNEEGLIFDKILDRQEGRVLCLAWHPSGNHIVTGSPDTIRVWDVTKGSPIVRMTTGRTEKRKETIVWSVAIMDDFTIMSGDSRGKTCFWDGKVGTLVDAFQTHKADVLTVAVNPNQDFAYSSGVDPVIMHFQPIIRKNGMKKWMKTTHRFIHTHDVRAIIALDKTVFSVGVDTVLAVNDIPTKNIVKYPAIPQGRCVTAAYNSNILLLRYPRFLEVWRLGKTSNNQNISEMSAGSLMSLESEPLKLVQLQPKDDEVIRSCCINSDGNLIAYATPTRIRIYNFKMGEMSCPSLSRATIKSSNEIQVSHHIGFFKTERNTWSLVSATENADLQILDATDDERFIFNTTITKKAMGLESSISHMVIENSIIAVVDHLNNIATVNLLNKKIMAKVPAKDSISPISSFNMINNNIIFTQSNHKMYELNGSTGKRTGLGANLNFPKTWYNRKFATKGILQEGRKIITYQESDICTFSKVTRKTSFTNPSPKVVVNDKSEAEQKEKIPETQVNLIRKYEHLIYFDRIHDNSYIVVEIKPQSIEEKLPPSLKQKKFSAM